MQNNIHLKGLNGLRAIAAFAVVVSHTFLMGKELSLSSKPNGIDLAGFGVSIFFALSGFLITYLLLVEKERFGKIAIKDFYIRRVLRIWPLYYLYLFISVAIIYFFNLSDLPGTLGYYIFLAANVPFIIGAELPLVGHYWSLGVEEQFYLFWPWVVKTVKNLTRFLIVFIAIFLLLKIGLRILDVKTSIYWPYLIIHVTRFECMAIGALGAVLCKNNNRLFYVVAFHPISQFLAWLAIALMAFNKFHIASVVDNDIVAALTVILIMNVAFNPKSFVNLENAMFDFLGKISFGIYVYHPLILFIIAKMFGTFFSSIPMAPRLLLVFATVIMTTITIAWISYTFFEKRFLKLKTKFAPVLSTANSRD